MPSLERMLNLKIIHSGKLKEAIEWGIGKDDFLIQEDRQIFDRLVNDFLSADTTGSIIGPELARRIFPQLDLTEYDPHVSVDHLCHELRKQRIGKLVLDRTKAVLEMATIDPDMSVGMLNDLHNDVKHIQPGKDTDVSFKQGIEKVLERYKKMKTGELVGVMSWPWEPLQANTKGVQEDDYVVLYGRPKSMKTWVLVYLIFWAVIHNKRVVFYTKEMTDLNLYMRMAGFFLRVIYDELRLGYMSLEKEEELMLLRSMADEVEQNKSVMCLSAKDAGGRDTVAWLHGKVEKYGADIVFIDGIYLMSVDGARKTMKDHERVMLISRQVREMNLYTRVPVVATIQANRKAEAHNQANLDEIAFSDALSQDCTIAARVIKSKDEVPNTVMLVMGGLREFDMVGFKIHAVPCIDFSFHSMLSQTDVDKARAEEEEETPNDKKKPPTKKPVRATPKGVPSDAAMVAARKARLAKLP